MKYITTVNSHEYTIEILDEAHLSLDGVVYELDFERVGNQPVYSLVLGGQSFEAHVYIDEEQWQVLLRGDMYRAVVEDERERRLRSQLEGVPAERGEFHLKAPMPGLVIAIPVGEGQSVEKGDMLVILESMKMQNELKAPRAGKVSRVRVAPGERVEQKQTLLSVI
jgi:biotin carboxyl carrier protein